MKSSIKLFFIEENEFNLLFNSLHQPTIEIANENYNSLKALLQKYPLLVCDTNLPKTVQMINFLLTGLEYEYIDDLEKFKEDYQQRIESEQATLVGNSVKLSDYGIYDVSFMHEPKLDKGKLIFFVKNDSNNLPYKVSVDTISSKAHYELLPRLLST